jgi:hypothetical protein
MAEPGVGINALVDVTHVTTKDIGAPFVGAQPVNSMVPTLVSEERVLQDSKTMSVAATGGSSLLTALVLTVMVVLVALTCVLTALGGKVVASVTTLTLVVEDSLLTLTDLAAGAVGDLAVLSL